VKNVSISRQRIASLWLKRLATDRIARQRPDPRPLVVTGRAGNVEQLVAVDAAAEQLGLRPGLALAQARAMYPELAVVAQHNAADATLLDQIADWCGRYTPLVALDPPDGVLLDISGCAHLFGGEAALVSDIATRVANFGFTLRIAVAGTIGCASAAARFTSAKMLAPESERECLAPLPLAALRLPAEIVSSLARVGFKRIGDVLDLPRAPLAARFGEKLLRQLDRALGVEDEPLNPRLPVAAYVTEQRFAEPIALEADVLAVTEKLARRLARMLEQRGEGTRQIELALFRTDGVVRRVSAATSRPIRDPQEIRALFVERLAAFADALDPGFGFDLAQLAIAIAEPCPPEQIGLGDTEERTDLARLVDRLSARLGSRRVNCLVAHDSHIPELAALAVPAQTAASGNDDGWAAFRRHQSAVNLATRPLRLLTRPEPIDAVAAVPDGPPVRFRWRRALHEVAASVGPERIEGALWSEQGGPARDYFRVEDAEGRRFWLFRSGLYRDTAEPRWFLHGLFA
jgi:protein ImuB